MSHLRYLMLVGFVLTLLAGYLPWVWHPAAALTYHLRDWAEWISLYPGVREGTPPMLVTFWLRAVPAACAVGLALSASWGWIPAVLVVLTMLPPLEFFRNAGADPNFGQQFNLALATLGAVGASFWVRKARVPALLAAGFGAAAVLAGWAQAWPAVASLYDAAVGAGVPLALAGFFLAAAGALIQPTGVGSGVGVSEASGVGDGGGVGVGSQTRGSAISTG